MVTARSSYAIEQRLPDRYSGSPSHQPTDNAHTTSLALALWLSLPLEDKMTKDAVRARVSESLERNNGRQHVRTNVRVYLLYWTPSPKNDRWSPSVERTKIPSLSRLSLTVEALFRTPYILYRQELCVPEISAAASAVTSYVGTSTHVGTEESRKTPKHAKQISNSTDAF